MTEYKFISIRYGKEKLKSDMPIELTLLNQYLEGEQTNIFYSNKYFQNGWKIKQFSVIDLDGPVFILLLEK